jgi:hypothetical protein
MLGEYRKGDPMKRGLAMAVLLATWSLIVLGCSSDGGPSSGTDADTDTDTDTDTDSDSDTDSDAVPPTAEFECPSQTEPDGTVSITVTGETVNPAATVTGGDYTVTACDNQILSDTFTGNPAVLDLDLNITECIGATAIISARVEDDAAADNFSDTVTCEVDIVITATYVDPQDGDDENPGTFELPVKDPQRAVWLANDNETILIKRGTTHLVAEITVEDQELDLVLLQNKTGVTIGAYGCGPCPVLDGSEVTISSLDNSTLGLLEMRNCVDSTFQDLEVRSSSHAGITIRNNGNPDEQQAHNCTVQRCVVDGTGNHGIFVGGYNNGAFPDPTPITAVYVLDNCVTNVCEKVETLGYGAAGGEAIRVHQADGFTVDGNQVWNHHKEGIDIIQNASNGFVTNNYVHDRYPDGEYAASQAGSAIYIDGATYGVANVMIARNLCVADGTGIVVGSENTGVVDSITVVNNVTFGNKNSEFAISTDEAADPLKTNIKLFNNTFISDKPTQYVVNLRETNAANLAGFEFKGNIVARTPGNGGVTALVNDDSADDSVFLGGADNNLYWNDGETINGPTSTNATTEDPLFTDQTAVFPVRIEPIQACCQATDLSLEFSLGDGSPAIDACLDLHTDEDLLQVPRPIGIANDLGALEAE